MAATRSVNPPKTLPADFQGWDDPASGNATPATLPANFSGWDNAPAAAPPAAPPQQFGSQSPDQILKQQAGLNPDAPLGNVAYRAVGGVAQGVKDAVGGLFTSLRHPIDTATSIYKNTADSLADAQRAERIGDVSRKRLDYLRAIPVIGPMAQDLAKQAAAGDIAGAVARGATSTAVGAALPKVAAGALGSVAKGAGRLGQYAAATPASQALAATRFIVPGEAPELLSRALKPSVAHPDFEENVDTALPEILKQNPTPGIKGFAVAARSAKDVVNDKYQAMKAPAVNERIDTTPMVKAQVNSIPATNLFETPGIVGATERMASSYDMTPKTVTTQSSLVDQFGKPITTTQTVTPEMPTLATLDDIRTDTNAKLKSFYNKEGGDQYAAMSNPNTARLKAVNDSSRGLVYGRISDVTGVPVKDIAANQNLYGALSDVAKVAGKRGTVYGRQNPLSLAETLAYSPGKPIASAVDFLGQRLLKKATGSDALVNSALDRFRNPTETPLVPRNNLVAKAGMKAGSGVRAAGRGLKSASKYRGWKGGALAGAGAFSSQDSN